MSTAHGTHASRGSRHPSRTIVHATASVAAVGLLATAGLGVAGAHSELTLEVDGVSRPVSTWQPTVGAALEQLGVELGPHDLVSPGVDEALADGSTVVVRTARPVDLEIDGERTTVWSTSTSADGILAVADAIGGTAVMAADRSTSRVALTPLVSRARSVTVSVAGTEKQVTALPGEDVRAVLAHAGIDVSPIDQVRVRSEGGSLEVSVTKVQRGVVAQSTEVAYTTEEQRTDDLFEGESEVETVGAAGTEVSTAWTEKHDGKVVHSSALGQQVTSEPVTQVVRIGTKKVTPEALVAAGIDPKATPEAQVDANGARSVRFRAALGSISTQAEIAAIRGETTTSASGSGSASASTGLAPLSVYSGEDPRAIAQSMVAARGWSDTEFQCLVSLWDRESGWNPYAANPSSGAYGIPQALPGSKMASAGADWQTNPATQITWGLGYIAGRYGTPCGAWAHSNSVGWY
ncbi:ubiquitin-like domain-containing protein [Actinomyces sp.]|uniref:aggregation-promoting factor C-terminal-like domain-containing protein n=1 Tax=Actinomyces sp. TaxID=29317 RepID=UPI0028986FD5|nr:ubiquitin-like domain-containing protein [Actinomyces sp.]